MKTTEKKVNETKTDKDSESIASKREELSASNKKKRASLKTNDFEKTNNDASEKYTVNVENKMDNSLSSRPKVYIGFMSRVLLFSISFVISLTLLVVYFLGSVRFKYNYNLKYNIKSDVNYLVYLKENEYYKTNYLKEGMRYITDLIDYVNVDMTYKLNTSEDTNVNYKYYVTADVIISDKNDDTKILYENTETLQKSKSLTSTGTDAIINETLKIDYSKYNDLVNSFKSKYVLSANSKLIVTMHVNAVGKNSNVDEDIIDNQNLSIEIPLSEQTINITKDYNDTGKSGTVFKYSFLKIVNYWRMLLAILFLVTSIISGKYLYKFIYSIPRRNNRYKKIYNKIMREYDRIIVSSSSIPDLTNYQVIDVRDFMELLDAREAFDKPILHIEIQKNQKSCFLVLAGNQAYRYILKDADLQDFNRK